VIDVHSCSYYCTKPQCIEAQRNELRDYVLPIYQAVFDDEPTLNTTMRQTMKIAEEKIRGNK